MTSKIRLLAVCAAATLALITWVVMADRSDNADSQAKPKNIELSLRSRAVVDDPKPISSNTKNQVDSTVTDKISPDLKYASQAEIDAMSLEEYLDYMYGLLDALPSGMVADIYTKKAIAEKHWESLGYFNEEQKQGYASYDKETLEALGDQGDLLALDILSHKYLTEDRNLKKSRETDLKAVLFGSSEAALSLASEIYSNEADDRSKVYAAMTWYEVATMMGDKIAKGFRDSTLRVRNITLSEREWTLIQQQAEATYARLNEKRREMGLPEFNK